HLKRRSRIVTLPHPRAGRVRVLGVPIRLHATPGGVRLAPPVLGQHTDAVLRALAGLRKSELARLRELGVILRADPSASARPDLGRFLTLPRHGAPHDGYPMRRLIR